MWVYRVIVSIHSGRKNKKPSIILSRYIWVLLRALFFGSRNTYCNVPSLLSKLVSTIQFIYGYVYIHIHLYILTTYLFEEHIDKERKDTMTRGRRNQNQNREISLRVLVHSPEVAMARLQSGAQDFIWVSHVGSSDPSTAELSTALTGALAVRWDRGD